MTKQLLLCVMAIMLLGATTANAASIECAGMAQDTMASSMDMPCHPNVDASDELSCEGCTCLHVVPYAEHASLLSLPEHAVAPHNILWRARDTSNPSDELFQPPI